MKFLICPARNSFLQINFNKFTIQFLPGRIRECLPKDRYLWGYKDFMICHYFGFGPLFLIVVMSKEWKNRNK